jgi:glycosyltransferase involved in cell wall biosynthesis
MNAGRPRVLMIVENLSVPSDRRVWQEAVTLADAGASVTVVCPRGQTRDTAAFEVEQGIEIHRYSLPMSSGGAAGYVREYGLALVRTAQLVRRLSRHGRFDVVHVANPPDFLVLAALRERRRGAAVVFDQHDLFPELAVSRFGRTSMLFRLTLLAERLAYSLADVVITANESYRRVAVTRGRRRHEKVFVVRNAPDVAVVDGVVPDASYREGKPFLLVYAGIMGPQDGADHAVRALAELASRRSDWQAVFVGEGDERRSVEQLARDLEIGDRVRFTGWLEHRELLRVVAAADLCLAPDPSNPLNDKSTIVKVLEYMALGRPIVSYDLPETRVSAWDAAVYARPNDTGAFADAIERLLDDPDARVRMGRIGRERIRSELSWGRSQEALREAHATALRTAAARSSRR